MRTLWILNHYAQPPDLPGGTRHFDLSRYLIKKYGWRIIIFTSAFHHWLRRYVKVSPSEEWKIEEIEGVNFLWIRTRPSYQCNNWRRLFNMIDFMVRAWRLGQKLPRLFPKFKRPDVVIGSSVHLFAPLAAYLIAKRFDAKFIMEVRDLWPQTLIDMDKLGSDNPLAKILRLMEKFLYKRAERIITLLPYASQYISALGIPAEKIVWIPNGVEVPANDLPEVNHTGSFIVMYVGAHGEANALETVLQAAKHLEDRRFQEIKFVLIGDGPEKPSLLKMAKEMRLANVEFRPSVKKEKVHATLRKADVLLFNLGKVEVFKYGISSNKLFDYMAAGRPIIFAVNAPNNPVQEAQCGLTVPPLDPQKLANSVIKLYNMPKEERHLMGTRAREYVEEKHSITKLAERLHDCLIF